MAKEILRYAGGAEPMVRASASDDELNLRTLWSGLWRRKWIMMFIVALITGAAIAFVQTATPLYSAETLIRLQRGDTPILINLPDANAEFNAADASTMESEIEALKSFTFIGRVVDQLNIMEDPEFNTALDPSAQPFWTKIDWKAYVPAPLRSMLFGDEVVDVPVGDNQSDVLRATVIQNFGNDLTVAQVGRSEIISIKFASEDPVKAGKIANAIADTYIVSQVETKFATAERTTKWLQSRVDEMRDRVIQGENKIAQYQVQQGLTAEGQVDTVGGQIAQGNIQLATAQAARAEAEARYNRVSGLVKSTKGSVAAANVLTSPLLTDLRAQESDLNRTIANLSATYGTRHPQMINARAELGGVRRKMAQEVQRIVIELGNEVEVTKAREEELKTQVSTLQGQVNQQNQSSVELRDLQREVDSDRQIFEAFLVRLRELIEAQSVQAADAVILSSADIPIDPSYPNKKLFVIVAFAAASMLAALVAFILERWDTGYGFRSADEVKSAVGASALSLVPDLARRDTGSAPAEDYIIQKPHSAFAEALQRVRTSLFMGDAGQSTRTVLVTSSVPVEGKTLISSSLARQSARSGLKTLLIDADLRRPRLHEVVRVANTNGLTDVLNDRVDLAAAVRTDEKSGMHFLPAGQGASSPPDLFRSQAMRSLLREASQQYDLVIIDTPPVAAVSDALILSGLVDKTLYVVRWDETPRAVVTAGIRQVLEAGADLAGVVLSRVNLKKHAKYGYADSGAYQGSYRRYYVN